MQTPESETGLLLFSIFQRQNAQDDYFIMRIEETLGRNSCPNKLVAIDRETKSLVEADFRRLDIKAAAEIPNAVGPAC